MTGHGHLFPGNPRDPERSWRHAVRLGGLGGWLLAAGLAATLPAFAGDAPKARDSLTAAVGSSDVSIAGRSDTWNTQWLQWDRRDDRGGLFARIEHLSRDADSGNAAVIGGHWLGRRWIVSGQLESGAGAAFIPERAAELHIGYRLDAHHVIRGGYRQAEYPGSTLHLWSLSGLLYRGDDEWELGLRHGELDTPRPQRINYGLLRGQWTCAAHWSCGVRVAAGRNVFGADEPGFDSGTGWQAGTFVAYLLSGGGSLRLDLDTGHARRFRQNAVTLSFRHAFAR